MTHLLIFQFGKKKERKALDLVFILSELFKMSKSEVKRKIKEGAFDLILFDSSKK